MPHDSSEMRNCQLHRRVHTLRGILELGNNLYHLSNPSISLGILGIPVLEDGLTVTAQPEGPTKHKMLALAWPPWPFRRLYPFSKLIIAIVVIAIMSCAISILAIVGTVSINGDT